MRKSVYIISFLMLLCGVLSAQDISVQQGKKEQLEKEIAQIDIQLKENASASRSALSQLTLIQKKIANRKALIAENEREIRNYSKQIVSTQRKISECQARVDTLSAYYARLVKSAYKNRDARIWYMYILASDNLGQAFRRYSYFKNLSSQMKDQAEKVRAAQVELEAEKAVLEKLKMSSEELMAQRQKEMASLSLEEKQSSGVVNQLKRSRSRYEKELASKKRQIEVLNMEIQRIINDAMKKGNNASKEIDYKLSANFSSNKGLLPWPADGPVIEKFGQNYNPAFPKLKLPYNDGITIAVAKGSEVKVVFDGEVRKIVVIPGYNQCVLVQHGSYFTLYCKLKTTHVKAGDKVKTGQTVGIVDTINGETQIHFRLLQNKTPQNPEVWLRKR